MRPPHRNCHKLQSIFYRTSRHGPETVDGAAFDEHGSAATITIPFSKPNDLYDRFIHNQKHSEAYRWTKNGPNNQTREVHVTCIA